MKSQKINSLFVKIARSLKRVNDCSTLGVSEIRGFGYSLNFKRAVWKSPRVPYYTFHVPMKMSPATCAVLLLLVAVVSVVGGTNSTISQGVGNSSLLANLSTTLIPITQVTTDLPINATDTTPGIKKGNCYDFDVFVLNNQLNIPYTVTCCIAVLCGFYLVLFGYRFFKCSLFLLGFLHATFVTYVICINHADLPMWGIIAVSAAVGVFCGLLTMFCSYCGLFLAGLGLGFFFGIAIFIVIETFYHVTFMWIPFGVLLGLSLIFSLLTLRWQKGFFIVATSLIGAALITGGVDYFIEEFVLLNYTRQRIMAGDVHMKCWVTWIILAIWPVMFILGNVVQFCKTGRSFSHKKRSDSVSLQGEDKAMKRYRSLNMNGDVVAKSYYTKDEDERRPTEV